MKQFSNTAERNAGKFRASWDGPFVIREVGLAGHYKIQTLTGAIVDKGWNVKYLKKYYQ